MDNSHWELSNTKDVFDCENFLEVPTLQGSFY